MSTASINPQLEQLGNYGLFTAEPLAEDYHDLPIEDGFDWRHIRSRLTGQQNINLTQLYLVVFRSTRHPDADGDLVTELDHQAHIEALGSSALLHYFAGNLDDRRRAMSWCLWTEAVPAREALGGSAHQQAARHAKNFYTEFSVDFIDVSMQDETNIVFKAARERMHYRTSAASDD